MKSQYDNMKRFLISLTFLLVVLSACKNEEAETNYYLSLSGESDHWKLGGYEIVMTPEESKLGYGTLTMKGEDEHMADFFSYHVFTVVDGEENSLHSGSVSGGGRILLNRLPEPLRAKVKTSRNSRS